MHTSDRMHYLPTMIIEKTPYRQMITRMIRLVHVQVILLQIILQLVFYQTK